jgi:hypothetical protein
MILLEGAMDITLRLTPEMATKLFQRAKRAGKSPEDLALEALQDNLSVVSENDEPLPPGGRLADFRQWLAGHPASAVNALDDSRESIYNGRGE